MTRRLLPLPARISILIRSRRGPLLILALATAAMCALERNSDGFQGAVTAFVVVVGLPLALTTVGDDLRKGVAPLWVQKPVNPVRFYLARFFEETLAAAGLSVITVSIVTLAVLRTGGGPFAHSLRFIVINALLAFVIASVAFGFSAVVPRAGKLATLTLLGFTLAWRVLESVDVAALDWPGSSLVGVILLPMTPLVELRAPEGIESGTLIRSLAWVLSYSAAWIGVGAVGIRRALSGGGRYAGGLVPPRNP